MFDRIIDGFVQASCIQVTDDVQEGSEAGGHREQDCRSPELGLGCAVKGGEARAEHSDQAQAGHKKADT